MLNIIIPIGGTGQRFKDENYLEPKPLIKILGKEMIFWLLDNLNIENCKLYIIYQEYFNKFRFVDRIKKRYGFDIEFIEINYETQGAVETVLYGLNKISEDFLFNKTVLLDCDTFYTEDIVEKYKKSNYNNAIFNFVDNDSNPIYSYVKKDKTNIIKEIKEKDKISDYANTGCYCFESAKLLKKYCNLVVESDFKTKNEYYISNIYKKMLDDNLVINSIEVENFYCLGTPHLIKIFSNIFLDGNKYRFCFDLDNTLVTYPEIKNDYSSVKPIRDNISFLKYLKNIGHTIIIYTARRMKTHNGNVGKVISDIGRITFDTLDKFGIEYDEIYFGKPYAHFYIDDLAINSYNDIDKNTGFYQTEIKPRDFNKISIKDNFVEKKSENDNIKGEIFYYENIPTNLKKYFPKLYSKTENSFIIEKIDSLSFSYLFVNKILSMNNLEKLLNTIEYLHNNKPTFMNSNIYLNYSEKLKSRFNSYDFKKIDPNCDKLFNKINNVLIEYEKKDNGVLGMIHGDPVFTNILIDKKNNIKFIDMRGKLGDDLNIYGDIFYDYAKIYQSLYGYDFILNNKIFDFKYMNEMRLFFENYLISKYNIFVLEYLKYLTASLYMSLIPLHIKENFDKCKKYYSLIEKII